MQHQQRAQTAMTILWTLSLAKVLQKEISVFRSFISLVSVSSAALIIFELYTQMT